MRTPQVIVTLSPAGTLQLELPGVATRRIVPLTASEAGATLLRVLHNQLNGNAELGDDGAPTIAQVEHWEKHHTFPREGCRFCIANGTGRPRQKPVTIAIHGDIQIRRLPSPVIGKVTELTLEELGL